MTTLLYSKNEYEILVKFQKCVKDFLNELVEQFPDEEDLLIMRIFLIDQIEIDLLISQFVKYILPHKEKIQKRDESFFINSEAIFGTLNSGKVLHFKKLWISSKLDKDDKNIIWKWFDVFINLIDKYLSVNKNE